MALGDEGRILGVASSVAHASGFDLEDLSVVRAGRRFVVRVVIDSDDGVDLDAAAQVSRRLSDELDALGEQVLGGAAYTLEVTSPGTDRPLTEPRHFRRAAGRLATMTLSDGTAMRVRIVRVDGADLLVLAGPDGLQPTTVPLAGIARARVEVEFGPPPANVAALLDSLLADQTTELLADQTANRAPAAPEGNDSR